jgi:hypothetical protein
MTTSRPAQAVDAAVEKLSDPRGIVGTAAGSGVPGRGAGLVVHTFPSPVQWG